jgi:hypothetical protein
MRKINLLPVKKSLAQAAVSATFLAFTVSALASNFTIEFFSSTPKIVDLTIDSVDTKTGDFSGEATGKPGELWEVVGTIVDGKVEMELSNLKSFKRIVASGEVQDDGIILGRAATDDGELMEWESSDAMKNI